MVLTEIIDNGGKTSIKDIPHSYERKIFLFLKNRFTKESFPDVEIAYQKYTFRINYPNGKPKEEHTPDFFLKLTPEGKRSHIETTTRSKEHDLLREKLGKKSKISKAKIVKRLAPDDVHIIFYLENLQILQRHNPEINIFQSKGKSKKTKGK
jgi:hypothetical protein